MKKLLNCIGAAILCCMIPAVALAVVDYPWKIPARVKIVQTAPTDGNNTFATLQGAIDSITDTANIYVIKVMPGTYAPANAGQKKLIIEGQGDSTEITGTLIFGADAVVKTLKAAQLPSFSSGTTGVIENVNFDITAPLSTSHNANLKFSGCRFKYTGATLNTLLYTGSAGSLVVEDSSVSVTAPSAYIFPHDSASVLLKNTDIVMSLSGEGDIFNVGGGSGSKTTVQNCKILLTSSGKITLATGGDIDIIDSQISVTTGSINVNDANIYSGYLYEKIYNSKLNSTGTALSGSAEAYNSFIEAGTIKLNGTVKAVNTMMAGSIDNMSTAEGDKLFNCYNAELTPLAIQ